jgi:hypothetical protein
MDDVAAVRKHLGINLHYHHTTPIPTNASIVEAYYTDGDHTVASQIATF